MGTDNQRHSSQDLQNRVFNYGKQEQLEKTQETQIIDHCVSCLLYEFICWSD